MMISQTSEHAIRALLYLAQRPAGESVPAERIARALGAPANYLSKTLNALARQGLLASARGPAGGFALRGAPDEITLARIVDAFGEAKHERMCMLGDRPCHERTPCRAHVQWTALGQAMRAPLQATTLADLLTESPHAGRHAAGADAGTSGRAAAAA